MVYLPVDLTTKDPHLALTKFNSGHGVVMIDLNKVDPKSVLDVSSGNVPGASARNTVVRAYARNNREVLIERWVPPVAVQIIQ